MFGDGTVRKRGVRGRWGIGETPFRCHSNAATNTITNSMPDSLLHSALSHPQATEQFRGRNRMANYFYSRVVWGDPF
jgi:hypothetical protein